jgi:phytoene desaturase
MTERILILGAGIGGLSAAIHLAARGQAVTLLEQNTAVGGKMSEWRQAAFRWDTGPSVVTLRHVFADLFQQAGRRMEDYLTFLPVDPLTRYFFPDGSRFDLLRDLPATAQQIEDLFPGDLAGYLDFLADAARLHRITGPVFTFGPPPGLPSLRNISLREALSVDVLHTLQYSIERRVRHPYLRQLLGRFATYVGASPYHAPATLGVIAHVEITEGIWYPQGGVYAIARAYERLARELGVEIITQARVQRILTQGSAVTGVQLQNGETIPARTVISNIDVTHTHQLLGSPQAARLARRPVSCSGFVMLLGVQKTHPQLAHHNIFFAPAYRREFEQIFNAGRPPDDPTIYLAITSKSDPSHAPAGCENWFVMVNAPALDERWDWTVQAQPYRDLVLNRLAARGLDVRAHILHERLLTPLDLRTNTGAFRGALYGIGFNDRFAPFKRPHNRSAIQGLYFTGGTTHPGGGVPLATLSGKLTARLVMEDMRARSKPVG